MTKNFIRCGTKSTFAGCRANGSKCVGNDSDEQIDEPKVKDNDRKDEKETRDKEFRVDHGVHHRRPLKP